MTSSETPQDQEQPEVQVEATTPQEEVQEEQKFTLTWETAEGETVTEEITREELEAKASALLETESISIGAEENRQIRQYEGNKYSMYTKVSTAGLPQLTRAVAGDEDLRKLANKVILNQLVLKIRGVFGFAKRCIHEQQSVDNIPNIDWRQGERPAQGQ